MRSLLLLCFLVACGGDDLDPDVVTDLPPGDATGTAASGVYELTSLTTACAGTCATVEDGFTFSACDVGTRLDDRAEITQADGALTVDLDGNDYVSRLAGGLDADGGFDVGGLRTQLGGEVSITARARGTLAGDVLDGVARLRVVGHDLDCEIEVELDGARR